MLVLRDRSESVPEALGNMKELNTLDLSGCYKFVSLPENIGNLSNLTSLNLCKCWNLERIPYFTQNPTQLTQHSGSMDASKYR